MKIETDIFLWTEFDKEVEFGNKFVLNIVSPEKTKHVLYTLNVSIHAGDVKKE